MYFNQGLNWIKKMQGDSVPYFGWWLKDVPFNKLGFFTLQIIHKIMIYGTLKTIWRH